MKALGISEKKELIYQFPQKETFFHFIKQQHFLLISFYSFEAVRYLWVEIWYFSFINFDLVKFIKLDYKL